jgi:hypothetical protein
VACWPLAAGRKQSTKEASQQTKLQLHETKKEMADEKHELHPFCPQVLQLKLRIQNISGALLRTTSPHHSVPKDEANRSESSSIYRY